MEESMLRELAEETGIKKVKSLGDAVYTTSYFYNNGDPVFKTIHYKAYSTDSDKVVLQTEELAEYRWVNAEGAKKLLPSDMQHLIQSVAHYFI